MKKHLFIVISVFLTHYGLATVFAEQSSQPSQEQISDTSDVPQSATEEIIDENTLPDYIPLDIPYTEHPLIDTFRAEYTTNFGKRLLIQVMQQAAVYRPFIREQLQAYDLPLALEFLPVIESTYDIHAVSRSGATGLWQFMENSIAGLLTKNEWLDERRDPWLSTVAAAKKLRYNYEYFGNWELALAAYNMGLNAVAKAITQAGNNDFWYLVDNGYLRSQTNNYVPKFIAVADLITNAEYYGIDIPPYDENASFDFVEITLDKQIILEELALATGIEYEIYALLNPALEYAVTPPGTYALRIPAEAQNLVTAALEKQEGALFGQTYTVKQGDTLWSLSQKYGTTVELLCSTNNRHPDEILSIGTVLFLPINK
ncbi:MAG: transglycosylase SLT domain-containing protein [Spirochaetales bacterium]